jgi:hypothetical protein
MNNTRDWRRCRKNGRKVKAFSLQNTVEITPLSLTPVLAVAVLGVAYVRSFLGCVA